MAKRKSHKTTRYELVENEFQKFDKIFGKIEALWIKDPSIREYVNVDPLFDCYRTFRDLRDYFELEHQMIMKERDEEDQGSHDA